MKNIRTLLLLAIALLLFNACQKVIDFDADLISPKMVINGFIQPDSAIDILIATSKPIPGVVTDFIWLTNATVVLYEDGVKIETLKTYDIQYTETEEYYGGDMAPKRPKKGYRSDLKAKIGKKYRLEVSHPDYTDVWCETVIPNPVNIISIDTSTFMEKTNYNETKKMKVDLKFKDEGNEVNYYRLIPFMKRGDLRMDYYQGELMGSYIQISEYAMRVNDPIINPEQEDANDILFDSPNNRYNVFTDQLINGKEYTISFDFNLSENYYGYRGNEIDTIDKEALGEFYQIHFILQSISYESFLYMKSSNDHKYRDGDLFVEPVQVYSNIVNGVGIFGGYTSTMSYFSKGEYPREDIRYEDSSYYYYY